MEAIEVRVARAAEQSEEMDALLRDYLPFIKKQAGLSRGALDYDDAQSLAMLTFMNAVRQYAPTRGAFLPFAAVCIKNRLVDACRAEGRRRDRVLEFPVGAEEPSVPFAYDAELERQALSRELERFGAALSAYGLDFPTLARCCPKQRRARVLCRALAARVVGEEPLRQDFLRAGRLPQAELARQLGISVKTVEKHRKYIVALAVLLVGDYPDIRAFLPKEVER